MKDPSLEQKNFFSLKTVNTKYQKLNNIVETATKLNMEERYSPEELNSLLETLYKEHDKSDLKKLAEDIYNVPDTVKSAIPEKKVILPSGKSLTINHS